MRPRREYERKPKWATEESEEPRREPRKKLDQPWFKTDRGGESLEESGRDGDRGWRRAGGKDRGWDRPAPVETSPEWMDTPAREEPTPVRTQADFERWKEMMKAGKSGGDPNNDQAVVSPVSPPPTATEPKSTLPQFFDEPDDSMDKFFSRHNEQKSTEQKPAAKPHGKTRFASLFGPPPPDNPQPPSPPAPKVSAGPDPLQQMFGIPSREQAAPVSANPSSADPDQAGFARILEMLQGRSNNPTPQTKDPKARVPLYARDSQPKEMRDDASSPLLTLLGGQPPPQQHSYTEPHDRHAVGPDRTESTRGPSDAGHGRQSSQKDELLLNLLKQANLAPKPTPMQVSTEQYAVRGMPGDSINRAAPGRNQMVSPPGFPDPAILQRRENGRSPAEETPIHLRYGDESSRQDSLAQRQASEHDMSLLGMLRRGGEGHDMAPSHGHGPPPGLSRPPGLEQMPPRMPPPGWAGQPPPPPPPQQQHRQPGPPPGMPNPGRPNIPPGYGMGPQPQGPGQRPPMPGPPPPPPQRKYTGDSGMPMMGPPPGFMGNGPPPGLMGGMFGGQQPPPPPQQRYPMQGGPPDHQGLGRAFMDMYGDGPVGPGGRNGVRGGVGGPMGGYR